MPGEGQVVHVQVDGRELALSNLDKVLYPEAGFRKGDVVDYYRRVAPALLPHLRGRPPTLVRAPDGPAGPRFFEKNCPGHRPRWVDTSPGFEATGGTRGCLVDDLPTLVWLANLAALELHTHQWTVDDPGHPTAMAIDLDPGDPAKLAACSPAALGPRPARVRSRRRADARRVVRRLLRRLVDAAPRTARALTSPVMELDGKVAIVTGASRGVGAATALLLATRGCKVACAARATDASPLPLPGTIDDTVRRIADVGGEAIAAPANLPPDADSTT